MAAVLVGGSMVDGRSVHDVSAAGVPGGVAN
jgi:hypothetical protein